MEKIRTIAIHLPQFHPIPENDSWWGKGFTEWTNVTKARPLFSNHYQPHLPADLGFYDMRARETRVAQAALAREFGISGFCYYHYWFHGKRLLHEPLDRLLSENEPDFPFMLCWANGSWTRTWEGNNDILIEQTYSKGDDLDHIKYLLNVFKDKRYIKVNGLPVLAVCRTESLPDPKSTAEIWQSEAKRAGFPGIYLIKMEMFETGVPASDIGFDACAEFQPDWRNFPRQKIGITNKIRARIFKKYDPYYYNNVIEYKDYVKMMEDKKSPAYKCFPGITPGWDNSPRKRYNATIMLNSTPGMFGKWFRKIIKSFKPYSSEENFIFINAWNEWAEGNHLEPDQKWGTAYLEEVRSSLAKQ
ncbi:glycoside hydrolase family 99-like domain-containing protein [Flavihumibacter sediminis]|nr:glycoside hydrolase family 99-like domain-containing protein [Flavihumibacter sediminis]